VNGYVAYVESIRHEIYADDLAKAYAAARALYKGRKKYPSVNVILAELNGVQVTHIAID
jgi:hypothetical protein